MFPMQKLLLLILLMLTQEVMGGEWKELDSLPDKLGFAGMYAGISHDYLLAAGGANFPEKKPWEGGKKVWYDNVYLLKSPKGKWQHVGHLPFPLGYGVSVSYKDKFICVGGSDQTKHHAEVISLEIKDDKLTEERLPDLPQTLANMCGGLVGDTIYIFGGQETPASFSASAKLFTLKLSAEKLKWESHNSFPGAGRILAVSAVFEDSFFVFSGCSLEQGPQRKILRNYLLDSYYFQAKTGWHKLENSSYSVTAGPTPAPVNQGSIFLLSADDGTQISTAPDKHPGFPPSILNYDLKTGHWKQKAGHPAPRVTTPCVYWKQSWVIVSGEKFPGVRSPEVWSFTPDEKE